MNVTTNCLPLSLPAGGCHAGRRNHQHSRVRPTRRPSPVFDDGKTVKVRAGGPGQPHICGKAFQDSEASGVRAIPSCTTTHRLQCQGVHHRRQPSRSRGACGVHVILKPVCVRFIGIINTVLCFSGCHTNGETTERMFDGQDENADVSRRRIQPVLECGRHQPWLEEQAASRLPSR